MSVARRQPCLWWQTVPHPHATTLPLCGMDRVIFHTVSKIAAWYNWSRMWWSCVRYASLYFCCCVEPNDNELLVLEVIHRYVELLDKYFGSVRRSSFLFLPCIPVGGEFNPPDPSSVCHCSLHCAVNSCPVWSYWTWRCKTITCFTVLNRSVLVCVLR